MDNRKNNGDLLRVYYFVAKKIIKDSKLGFLGNTSSEEKLLDKIFSSNDFMEITNLSDKLSERLNKKQDKLNKVEYSKETIKQMVANAISVSGRVSNKFDLQEKINKNLSSSMSSYSKLSFCINQIIQTKKRMLATYNESFVKRDIFNKKENEEIDGKEEKKSINYDEIKDVFKENYRTSDRNMSKGEPSILKEEKNVSKQVTEFVDEDEKVEKFFITDSEELMSLKSDDNEIISDRLTEHEMTNDKENIVVVPDREITSVKENEEILSFEEEIIDERDNLMPLKSNNNEMTIEELSEHEISNNGEEISKDYSDSDTNYEDDSNLEEKDELLTEIIRDSLYEQEVSTLKDNLEYANMMGENSEGDWDKFFDGLDEIDKKYPLFAKGSSELESMLEDENVVLNEDSSNKHI